MDNDIKLTCVTAVYNAISSGNEGNLIRCVESVAKINIPHEHLIYDGGSDDGSVALLRELEQKFPTLRVVSEKDTGIYNALNKGVRDAKGKWFFVLGCDDYIFNSEEIVCAVEVGDKCHSDMVGSLACGGSPDNIVLEGRKRLFCGSPYSHQGILMNTNMVRKLGGFDERYKIAADFDLMQKAFFGGFSVVEYMRAYCCDGLLGVSSDAIKANQEKDCVIINRFGLIGKEVEQLQESRIIPFRIIRSYLFSKFTVVRIAAWYQLLRIVAHKCGLLK